MHIRARGKDERKKQMQTGNTKYKKQQKSILTSDEKLMLLGSSYILAPDVADFSVAPKAPSHIWSPHWYCNISAKDLHLSISSTQRFSPVHRDFWDKKSHLCTEHVF